MPYFSVLVTRDATESAVIPVSTVDPCIANVNAMALELAVLPEHQHRFTVDEGNDHEPYLGDERNAADEIDEERYLALIGQGPSSLSKEALLRLLTAIDEMFTDDANWSVADLDGYCEVAEAVGHTPEEKALTCRDNEPTDD